MWGTILHLDQKGPFKCTRTPEIYKILPKQPIKGRGSSPEMRTRQAILPGCNLVIMLRMPHRKIIGRGYLISPSRPTSHLPQVHLKGFLGVCFIFVLGIKSPKTGRTPFQTSPMVVPFPSGIKTPTISQTALQAQRIHAFYRCQIILQGLKPRTPHPSWPSVLLSTRGLRSDLLPLDAQ